MNDVFLPSGRVTYLPLCDHVGDRRVVSMRSGEQRTVEHTTLVDATFLATSIPSTHERKFEVADGLTCIPPNQLPHRAASHRHITVFGGGKTGADALTWLPSNGFPTSSISWVVPRDSWFWTRRSFQPGMEFFDLVFDGLAQQYEAIAAASSANELCLEMERIGRWVRIDPTVRPTMFHAAILSEHEVDALRTISHVNRHVRVRRIEPGEMIFDDETVEIPADSLFVDRTASTVATNVNDQTSVFAPGADQPPDDPPVPTVLQFCADRIHRGQRHRRRARWHDSADPDDRHRRRLPARPERRADESGRLDGERAGHRVDRSLPVGWVRCDHPADPTRRLREDGDPRAGAAAAPSAVGDLMQLTAATP